ncbi:hypothetical protein S7711_10101 [Stachybotrys chartarum IBT 7711]|uniref:Uncharacterized protein n=1 Tax=Stachybotrys chartarum (strain CBS 109288 / IBT 7711) TaxID=1280523 RepID=A0A084B1L5_STACB|nr:hypothetical protein S7711_10101 [Stachybotrys chartarum IBT 7711]
MAKSWNDAVDSNAWFTSAVQPQPTQHASANIMDIKQSQVEFQQILDMLPALSIHQKRQIMGLLALETGLEAADETPAGHSNASTIAMNPSRRILDGSNQVYFEQSKSLRLSMEVTRYERWLRGWFFAHPYLPDPHMNTLRLLHTSFYAAILANSISISLKNQEVFKDEGLSPYSLDYKTGHKIEGLADAHARFDAHVPRDLRPTDVQLLVPHHPYLDVIPFASFRQRAVAALAATPPLFDESEMCQDMEGEGLICWGGGGNDARSSGIAAEVPWDSRSWEPRVWFLRKYWYLVGGWEDEMWRSARWWAAMRNEQISLY